MFFLWCDKIYCKKKEGNMNLRIDDDLLKEVTEIRHDIHKNPETSSLEFRTSEIIRNFAKNLDGVEIIEFPLKTGVVCRIKSCNGGKSIGLRCDIDALEQTEENELSYKSQNKGVMHACGHDLHTASLLGILALLSKNKDKLNGDVVFVFQKAEETTTGAKELIDAGLFDKVNIDMFFGFHNWPLEDAGKVILKEGALMSTKVNFEIDIIGRGGHGSMPHLNIDPIVCASNVVMALQTVISRNTNPLKPTLLSVNSIKGGSEKNLVVDRVKMTATIRSLDTDSLFRAKKRSEEIINEVAKAYECRAEIKYEDIIPLVDNSKKMYNLAENVCKNLIDHENIIGTEPTMASEDFAYYMQKVPAFMYWFGSGEEGIPKYPLHAKKFFASDKAIKTIVEVLANSVLYAQNN